MLPEQRLFRKFHQFVGGGTKSRASLALSDEEVMSIWIKDYW